jgi:hypothetical protein
LTVALAVWRLIGAVADLDAVRDGALLSDNRDTAAAERAIAIPVCRRSWLIQLAGT